MSDSAVFFHDSVPEDVAKRVRDNMESLEFPWCVVEVVENPITEVSMLVFCARITGSSHKVFWYSLVEIRTISDTELYSRLTDDLAGGDE